MRARPDRETVAGSPTKQSPARPQVVSFCLLLWMFLLGFWAGQTILLPTGTTAPAGQPVQRTLPPPQVVVPGEKG